MIDYTELKKGDVIAITNYSNRLVIVDEIKYDKRYSSPQIYTYAELDNDLYITFKNDNMFYFYLFEDIIARHATEDEKNKMYNAIYKYFTEEYDKDWYNHFTDNSCFDVQDCLLDAFRIKVSVYDDDLIYPDFINEIHQYILGKLCETRSATDIDVNKSEMVNKQEFIEKTISYFTSILKVYCSEACVKDLMDGFVSIMEE